MAYLLDSNVLITAKRIHYGFDFCPGFWNWIKVQHAAGAVFSVEKVLEELRSQQDDLADWVNALPSSFFLKPDAATAPHYAGVTNWVTNQDYHRSALNEFLRTADYHLVAQALQGQHHVVTYEVPGRSPRRVKIPDACLGLGLTSLLPHELLRRQRASFVLGEAR
ncbi:MAG: DUF4411 family protein [Acidobacteria bacterium]|nr:DUF4411 family protein [Acidobacteriota bacterium]